MVSLTSVICIDLATRCLGLMQTTIQFNIDKNWTNIPLPHRYTQANFNQAALSSGLSSVRSPRPRLAEQADTPPKQQEAPCQKFTPSKASHQSPKWETSRSLIRSAEPSENNGGDRMGSIHVRKSAPPCLSGVASPQPQRRISSNRTDDSSADAVRASRLCSTDFLRHSQSHPVLHTGAGRAD